MTEKSFAKFFKKATGFEPYPYQNRLATGTEDGKTAEGVPCESRLIHVPTGAGKTEAVVTAWLWNRVHRRRDDWPRRLVYCLPMRVLVEQTRDRAVLILYRLKLLAGTVEIEKDGESGKERVKSYEPDFKDTEKIPVVILMGGETDDDWDHYPERNAILIGTQDMLLSRALNRGYAMGRSRWPVDFAWLNNDCLWVMDEVQLMGSGLSTSTQLQAWREGLVLPPSREVGAKKQEWPIFGRAHSWWMSATLQPDWLKSVDFQERVPKLKKEGLSDKERTGELAERYGAAKSLEKAKRDSPKSKKKSTDLPKAGAEGYEDAVADFVVQKHNDQRQLTLVVLNTVDRAVKVYEAIRRTRTQAVVHLLHSRFRPRERMEWAPILNREACREENLPEHGRIIVSTQVVEAGVDISAKVLVTELAPWPSLVQRFGRANRYGEYKEPGASVFWLDLPDDGEGHEEKPYEASELKEAREHLAKLSDVSPKTLDQYLAKIKSEERAKLFPFAPSFVPRDKDLFELFDTTPDLTGADIDVARFIRDGRELDVLVFWREVEDPNEHPQVEETREELCPVPFYRFKDAMDRLLKKHRAWRWDYLEGRWERLSQDDKERVYPGQVFLLEKSCGGYSEKFGWTGEPDEQPSWLGQNPPAKRRIDDSDHANHSSEADWKTITQHGGEVETKVGELMGILPGLDGVGGVMRLAARLHDWGKAAEPFQSKINEGEKKKSGKGGLLLAKAPAGAWLHWTQTKRPGFRHEVASALAVLETVRQAKPRHPALAEPHRPLLKAAGLKAEPPHDGKEAPVNGIAAELAGLSEDDLNLLLYLICAHHGKVRLSLRASPKDLDPDAKDPCPPDKRQARGVRDGDEVPAWGPNGPSKDLPGVKIHLDPMEAGLSPRYGPSWQERALALRDKWGPFRLAYLEALVRVADWRASG